MVQMKNQTFIPRLFIIAALTVSMVALPAPKLFPWGLFSIFTDAVPIDGETDTAGVFNPERDILYLPMTEGRDIFETARDLSILRNSEVRKHLYLYLTSKRAYTVRAISRSYRYEDAIIEIMRENDDLPEELWLLPLLESCFNPHAVSSSRAIGLWQIMKNTSKPLGLRVDRWIDERRSIIKSTEAALRHLRTMQKIFPRWDLALAAYNGGAGYIRRAMDRTGINGYWDLAARGLLRTETGEYVPKFLALMLIYQNQRLFGIADEIVIPVKKESEIVELKRPADLADVARISGVPLRTLRELNPDLRTTKTPPAIAQYHLVVPAEARDRIDEDSDDLYKNGLGGVIEYQVKKGDTISEIARRYNKKTSRILRLNGIKNAKSLQIGRIIYVPK